MNQNQGMLKKPPLRKEDMERPPGGMLLRPQFKADGFADVASNSKMIGRALSRTDRISERITPSAIIAQIPGADPSLATEISALEIENFNPDLYINSKCQTMTEANIRRLCSELAEYRRMSAEQMKKTVYDNYKSFIRSSKEIADLEGELRAIHSLLTAQSNVLRGLMERPGLAASLSAKGKKNFDPFASAAEEDAEEARGERGQKGLMGVPEQLVVCLAERNYQEALRLLEQGQKEVQTMRTRMRSISSLATAGGGGVGVPTAEELEALEKQLQGRRADLLQLLADVTMQPSVTRADLRQAVANIAALGDAKRAHTLLLDSHARKMHASAGAMKPMGISYSVMYTTQVSRQIFSTIQQAVDDSKIVFGASLDLTSELVLWAHSETEWCSALLQRHVLSSAAAAGGLRLAAECVQIAVSYCSLLEERGLALVPVLLRLVRPSVEEALEANIQRIKDSVGAMASADDWLLHVISASSRAPRGGPSAHSTSAASPGGATSIRMTSSALRLYNMVQDFLEDVVPIVNMQLTTATLDGILHLFKYYMAILNKARTPMDEPDSWQENVEGGEERQGEEVSVQLSRASTEKQQLALIANATALAEELPRLAVKLSQPSSQGQEQRTRQNREQRRSCGGETKRQQMQQWKKSLTEEVENFRMAFCLQMATKLLFPDSDQEAQVLPHLYFYLDQCLEEEGPISPDMPLGGDGMPTQTLQDFLRVVVSISESASQVLVRRDRMVLTLLTQFGLALLTLICHDQAWEDEQCSVGPLGLQRFLLDVTFLKEVAARFHFSSRRLQQEADTSMERARFIFDPDRHCPRDAEIQEVAQAAMAQLLPRRFAEIGDSREGL